MKYYNPAKDIDHFNKELTSKKHKFCLRIAKDIGYFNKKLNKELTSKDRKSYLRTMELFHRSLQIMCKERALNPSFIRMNFDIY